jgi:hypothetical protein
MPKHLLEFTLHIQKNPKKQTKNPQAFIHKCESIHKQTAFTYDLTSEEYVFVLSLINAKASMGRSIFDFS